MPQGVTYDVNAFLKTQGSFQKEMSSSARAADQLGRSYGSMSDRMVSAGERVRGTFGATARELARGALFAGAAGLAGGVAMAAREGVKFNNAMEQGALGLGTMYTTFGVAENSAAVLSGEMSQFAKSTELAVSMQQELFDIAKKSPATFEDIGMAYQSMAPGVSGVTKDLLRQRDLMERISVLGFTTQNDFNQLGADVGRIVQGLAGADVRVFKTLEPVIRDAFKAYTGEEAADDFAQQFNKMDPAARLEIFEKALANVPPEVNEAFGKSFGGMAATIQSQSQVVAGAFGKPLMTSMKKAMSKVAGEESPLDRLEVVARFAGEQLARGADYVFARLISGAEFVANNWGMIATKIQEAGVLAGAALKAASVIATARLVAGYGMIAVGKGAAAAQAIGGAAGRARAGVRGFAQREHLRRGRRLRERGPSRAQKGVGVIGAALGKTGPGLDRFVLRFGTFATLLSGGAVAMGGLVLAFSAIAVIVGGLTAYLVSSWDTIKSSIVTAMMDGTITLVPLITALYTFWERLKLAGEAIFGNVSAVGVMTGGLDMMTGAVDFASSTIGGMITVVSYMVQAWGGLKLAMAAIFKLIADGMRSFAKMPGVGDKFDATVLNLDKLSASTLKSSDKTLQKAEQLRAAGDAIAKATLDPMKLKAAEKKAKSLEEALSDALTGDGDDKKKKRAPSKTKVDVKMVVNTTDPNVDRLMAGIINFAEKQNDKRVQAYEGPMEQGV